MKTVTRRVLSLLTATALTVVLTAPASATEQTIKDSVNNQQIEQKQEGAMTNFRVKDEFVGFVDVAPNDWFYDSVKSCYELSLMKGNSSTTFNPKGNVTLAEVITMASRVHKIYFQANGDFENTGAKWYQAYIDYALLNKIISQNRFGDNYDRPATRAEMAGIFAYALPSYELSAINSIASLPDIEADRYVESTLVVRGTSFYNEILFLYNAGILSGSDKYGSFNPNSNITRGEAAAIINRIAIKSERKQLTLEAWTGNEPITIYEGQTRSNRPAKAGDTVIKADGTKVVLTTTRFTANRLVNGSRYEPVEVDLLGYNQGVAPDLGLQSPSGFDVVKDQERQGYSGWGKNSVGINYINDFYYVNPLTGSGHWGSEWSILNNALYPDGEGKAGEISADKNFIYDTSGVPGWALIANNTFLLKDYNISH